MEMVINGVGLLTRFLGTCSPSSGRDSVERPRCSQQRARGCPCLSPSPKALGDRSPRCPRAPWQGEGRLGLHELGPSSSSLPLAGELTGRCRWHKERCHTRGQRDTAPSRPRTRPATLPGHSQGGPPKFTPFSPKCPRLGTGPGGEDPGGGPHASRVQSPVPGQGVRDAPGFPAEAKPRGRGSCQMGSLASRLLPDFCYLPWHSRQLQSILRAASSLRVETAHPKSFPPFKPGSQPFFLGLLLLKLGS